MGAPSHWPARPYLGLSYYREEDAKLFCERELDVKACSERILGFGVKILVLQGSSGAGKSSFLRAGLIPKLMQNDSCPIYFLSGDRKVMRCTSDPIISLARTVSDAIKEGRLFDGEAEEMTKEIVEKKVKIDDIIFGRNGGTSHALADLLLEALQEICGSSTGKLLLIFDQAEELFTGISAESGANSHASAFFHFLDEIYFRNIDVKIIVSLRTEYYGRFRDELGISDNRLVQRTLSGGVEPYLLKPIRDREALRRIVLAPVNAGVYDFSINDVLIDKVIGDLLEKYKFGSVTPLLQIIFSKLFAILQDRRSHENGRVIEENSYAAFGGLKGITEGYLESGIQAALGEKAKSDGVGWHRLLVLLISRQSGGTFVSLTMGMEELQSRAAEFNIRGAIGTTLIKLCNEPTPLLRGEPENLPRSFSLKHDFLARVLWDWKNEFGVREEQVKIRKKWRNVILMISSFLFLVISAIYLKSAFQSESEEREKEAKRSERLQKRKEIITARVEYSRLPYESNFYQSLYFLIDSIDITEKSEKIAGLHKEKSSPSEDLSAVSYSTLREVLTRTPRMAGEYGAVGVDPEGDRVILLRADGSAMEEWTLSDSDTPGASFKSREIPLPVRAKADLSRPMSPPAVGYVKDIGPVAAIGDNIYYLDGHQKIQMTSVFSGLHADFSKNLQYPAMEFAGGGLYVTALTLYPGNAPTWVYGISLTAAEIKRQDFGKPPEKIVFYVGIAPPPVFSEDSTSMGRFAYLRRRFSTGKRDEGCLELSLGDLGKKQDLARIKIGDFKLFDPGRDKLGATFAFLENGNSILIRKEGQGIKELDMAVIERVGNRYKSGSQFCPDSISSRAISTAFEGEQKPNPAYPVFDGSSRAVFPALAGVKVSGKDPLSDFERMAWVSKNGIWVADALGNSVSTKASPIFDMKAPLLSATRSADKLQFTKDGKYLILQNAERASDPIQIRIWDLTKKRYDWIMRQSSDEEIYKIACNSLRGKNAKELELRLGLATESGDVPGANSCKQGDGK